MKPENYTEKNRAAWNQVAPIHRQHRKVNLHEAVKDPAYTALGEIEQRILSEIDLRDKKVAHLCCNNGRELLSILRMGAAYGVGFDISDAFIQEAQELAALAGIHCDFVRADVLEIPASFDKEFDLVVFTIGALTWIAELDKLFAVCRRLLKPGGTIFIYEMHPALDMMAGPDDPLYNPEDELKIVYPYFNDQPWVESSGLDYIGGTVYEGEESVCFPHNLTEIFTTLIQNNFVLVEFKEYPHDISAAFAHLEKYGKIPMCYSLVARQPA